jgi:hypothetical protein
LLDEVARHALLERVAAAEDGDAPRVVREVQSSLPGRVAGADDVNVEPMGGRRVAAGRTVRDALPGEPFEALGLELPPGDSAREDDRPGAQDVAAVEVQLPRRGIDPRDRPRDEHLGAEPPRLLERPACEFLAGHARREPEIVLDSGGGAGLASGRLALDHDRPQPLGGAVDRGGQAGRPGADDHDVVLGGGRLRREPEQLGHTAQLGPDDGLAVDDADGRAVHLGRQRAAPLLRCVGRIQRDPPEADLVPVEEAPQVGAGRIESVADHERSRRRRLGGDPLQSPGTRDPVRGEPPDLFGDVGLEGRDRVVVVRLDSQHAGRLGRAEADGEERPQRDRHLAEDVADRALADDARDSIDELDRLDPALEHREERAFASLVGRVLPGCESDVRRRAGEPLPIRLGQGGEDRDRPDLLRRDHGATLAACVESSPCASTTRPARPRSRRT